MIKLSTFTSVSLEADHLLTTGRLELSYFRIRFLVYMMDSLASAVSCGMPRARNVSGSSILSVSSSLREVAAIANRFVEISLDDVTQSAQATLQRWLSIRSAISAASSKAIAQQEAALDSHLRTFRSIGKGFCAEVFDQVGKGRVLKRAFTPWNNQLFIDFQKHVKIRDAVYLAFRHEAIVHLLVPKVYGYYNKDSVKWWDKNRTKWPHAYLKEPTDVLETERIFPLPKIIRDSLIDRYCAPEARSAAKANANNRDCLIRLYLGIRRSYISSPSFFSIRNFEADLNIVDELGIDKIQHAAAMGLALAGMHWIAKTDAADVEFVLGSQPDHLDLTSVPRTKNLPMRTSTDRILDFKKRSNRLWLLDFNQCRAMAMTEAGVIDAVEAFWNNDPYYPRPVPPGHPDEELWIVFQECYLIKSNELMDSEARSRNLALKFIAGLEWEAGNRFKKLGVMLQGPPRGDGGGGGNGVGKRKGRVRAGVLIPELE